MNRNRSLNLNTAKRPTFELTMMDDDETVLHVKVPELEVFKELQAVADSMNEVDENDADTLDEELQPREAHRHE